MRRRYRLALIRCCRSCRHQKADGKIRRRSLTLGKWEGALSAQNVIGHKFKVGQVVHFRSKPGSQASGPRGPCHTKQLARARRRVSVSNQKRLLRA
jgi:hypothetical protein